MGSMPLLSVIIPCYNVEKYIDRCMETVTNQTIRIENLELILVNDASTDGTLDKLYEWERKFPENIMVITYDKNIRQGGARNIGIQYASAEYIGFVDSDDWVELDAFERLYEKTKERKYHKISGRFIRESYQGQKDLSKEIGEIGSICTAIYLKKLILENNIWFPEGVAYEDNYWSSVLKIYATDVCAIDEIIYHYFVNHKSTVTARGGQHHLDRLEIEIGILEEYKSRGVFEQYREELEAQFVQRFYLNSLYTFFTRFDELPAVLEDMRQIVWKYFPNFRDNVYFENCNEREKVLLKLLDVHRDFTQEEWLRIKMAYLKSF